MAPLVMALASVPPLYDLYGETAAAIIVIIIAAAANTAAHVLASICTALSEPNNPLCVAPTPTSTRRARSGRLLDSGSGKEHPAGSRSPRGGGSQLPDHDPARTDLVDADEVLTALLHGRVHWLRPAPWYS